MTSPKTRRSKGQPEASQSVTVQGETKPDTAKPKTAQEQYLERYTKGGMSGVAVALKMLDKFTWLPPGEDDTDQWKPAGTKVALGLMDDLMADVKPATAIERMLVEQMLVTHAQALNMHRMAHNCNTYEQTERLINLASKMQSEFRKTALALREMRQPPRPIINAQQANIANNQIVNPPAD